MKGEETRRANQQVRGKNKKEVRGKRGEEMRGCEETRGMERRK